MSTQQIDLYIFTNENNLTFKYKNSNKLDDYTSIDVPYNELICVMDESDLITFRYAVTGNLFGSWSYKYIDVQDGVLGSNKEGIFEQICKAIFKSVAGGSKVYNITTEENFSELGKFYKYSGDDTSKLSVGDILFVNKTLIVMINSRLNPTLFNGYLSSALEVNLDIGGKYIGMFDCLLSNPTTEAMKTDIANIQTEIGTIESTLKTING